jgi:hypothetical protein
VPQHAIRADNSASLLLADGPLLHGGLSGYFNGERISSSVYLPSTGEEIYMFRSGGSVRIPAI